MEFSHRWSFVLFKAIYLHLHAKVVGSICSTIDPITTDTYVPTRLAEIYRQHGPSFGAVSKHARISARTDLESKLMCIHQP